VAEAVCAGIAEEALAEERLYAGFQGNLTDFRGVGERSSDNLLIFFGFEGAGGVNDAAAGPDSAQGGQQQRKLAFGLAGEVFKAQPVADLRVAAQCACAAARHVGKDKIECGVFGEGGCVGEPALDPVAKRGETLAQRLKSLGAGFAGQDACRGVALGEDEGLVAGGRAGIENPLGGVGGSQFCDQLGTFVLEAQASPAKGRAASHVAGDDGAGAGKQFSGLKLNAGGCEFFGSRGVLKVDSQDGLDLAVMAKGPGGLKAVKGCPALDQPGRVGLGESKIGGGFLGKASLRG
jgi:hypothetical protein